MAMLPIKHSQEQPAQIFAALETLMNIDSAWFTQCESIAL